MTLEKNLQELDSYLELKEGWYGEDSKPIEPSLIELSERIVRSLGENQGYIYPTCDSDIQIEYSNDFDEYLEFTIQENGKIMAFYCTPETEQEKEILELIEMPVLVEKFLKGEINETNFASND
jgi:hypothetical protein